MEKIGVIHGVYMEERKEGIVFSASSKIERTVIQNMTNIENMDQVEFLSDRIEESLLKSQSKEAHVEFLQGAYSEYLAEYKEPRTVTDKKLKDVMLAAIQMIKNQVVFDPLTDAKLHNETRTYQLLIEDMITTIDPRQEVNVDYLDLAFEDEISLLRAVRGWFDIDIEEPKIQSH